MKDIEVLRKEIEEKYKDYWVKESIGLPKVSIIVPMYNVEDFIEECLSTLIRQTLKEIEIIVINDGSPDSSVDIARCFEIDSRIKIYEQENAGLSATRNNGISYASGEYITFVDSDDWVDLDFFEKLYNSAKNNDSDIACATIIRKREHSQKYRVHFTEEQVLETLRDKLHACAVPRCCYVWNKIYRASFIKDFKFKEGVFFEDVLWTPKVLRRSNKLVTVPNTSYYYRVNKNSIVKKIPSLKKQIDKYNSQKFIVEFFKENNLPLSKKDRNITKRIYFCLGVPYLKIKEFEDTETTILFGFLPIFKKKI